MLVFCKKIVVNRTNFEVINSESKKKFIFVRRTKMCLAVF